MPGVKLLVGTRKGAWILESDKARRSWSVSKPHFFGHIVNHLVQDPRNPRVMLAAAKTGHLGPTVFRSADGGRNWKEASQPPAFRKAPEGKKGLVVDHTFWLTPAHASEPGVWYAGTSPQGLFRSDDNGDTWSGVRGFNEHPMRDQWCAADQEGPPDGARMHSILVDPRDKAHLYLGMSSGGVFESRDQGASWAPLNKGCAADFLPTPDPEFGHDPHCVRLHPLMPDRLYQQNHCGIYRIDRPGDRWTRIGDNMPRKIGDIGFPMTLHPRDPDTCWVFPMDGTTVWPRTSVGGKPAVYVTHNAGKKWIRQDGGLPQEHAWWTVFRQAMTADAGDPVGLYFGTTSGEVWASRDEGGSWKRIADHLPRVMSVEAAA
jgi:photosystem II stability/assembly factor-like uncharacterized protein